jgi:hypothetical protein
VNRFIFLDVTAGHSRPKDSVASLAYVTANHASDNCLA